MQPAERSTQINPEVRVRQKACLQGAGKQEQTGTPTLLNVYRRL